MTSLARRAPEGPEEARARRRRVALEERDVHGSLSEDEGAELAEWRRFEKATRGLTLRAQNRPSFAAAALRYADGGTLWLGFAEDPDVALAAALSDFPWPSRVRAYRTARSLNELKAIQETIEAQRGELASHGVTVIGLGVDGDANVVRVLVPPSAARRAARELSRFGDAVRVEGGVVRQA